MQLKKVDVLAQIHPQEPKYQGIKRLTSLAALNNSYNSSFGTTVVNRGGWKVITTLNLDLQNNAEELVASNLRNVTRYGADTEAMVNEDVQTGEIVSLVGGTDFNNPDHAKQLCCRH